MDGTPPTEQVYREMCADLRFYDGQLWKVPAITILLTSATVFAAYSFSGAVRLIMLVFGFLGLIILSVLLVKFRRFYHECNFVAERIEESWINEGLLKVKPVRWTIKLQPDAPSREPMRGLVPLVVGRIEGVFIRYKAYHFMLLVVLLADFAVLAGVFRETLRLLGVWL